MNQINGFVFDRSVEIQKESELSFQHRFDDGVSTSGSKQRLKYWLATVSLSILASVGRATINSKFTHKAALVALGVVAAPVLAQAHTDSLGYILTPGSEDGKYNAQVVYGSWHPGTIGPEGSVNLYKDGDLIGTETFSILLADVANGTLPDGLTTGQNYFFANGSELTSDPSGHTIYNFQSATFLDLTPGTYTFSYASTSGLSQNWEPSGIAISQGSFIITDNGEIIVPGTATDIDSNAPSYNASNLGDTVNPAFTGGTLVTDENNASYSNNFTLDGSPSNTIDSSGNHSNLTGSFSDADPSQPGQITFDDTVGGGSVTLEGHNTHTGGTTVNDGTLALSGNGTLGADANTTTVNGGTLDLGGTNQTQQQLVQAGGTVQDGTINVDTYTMSDGQLAADATVVASNSFDLSSGDVDGVLDGSGALTKSGSGTVTLTNDNGYTGGTTVNDGTLALSGNGTLGADANTTTVNGGTLDLGGTNQTQQQLVQAGGTVQDGTINVDTYTMSDGQLAADATVVASNSFDLSSGDVDGVLDGSGALTKSGSGTVTLTNDNGYTGGTTVNDGTLALSGNGTLGADANTTTVNGGTLDLGGTNQTQQQLVQAGGTVQDGTINVDTYTMSDGQLAADATVVASNSFDLSSGDVDGVLDGSGALTKSGSGTVTLTNDNGYTGGTTVNDGTLALSGNGTLGADANTTTVNGGTLDLGGTNQTQQQLVQAGGTVQDGTINVDTYTMSDGQLAADATVVASNSFDLSSGDVDGVLDGSGALTKSGSGTVTLTNDNGYTGGTTVNDGTLALSGNGTLGADANTTTVNGGTLDLGGTNQTQQQLVQAGGTVQDGTINVDTYTMSDGQLAADATVVASNSFDLSSGDVDGVLDGSGALTKSGSGTVTLTNDNGYTGGTTVNDGTLALSGNGTLGADANTTTVNGGTLDLGGTNQTQQQLVQAGGTVQDGTINVDTYTMSDGQLAADATVVASNSFDLSSGDVDGVLDGSGALTKSGSGTVTLTNDNGYTGGTTVNDGTLALSGNGTLGADANTTTVNGGTLDLGGTNQTQQQLAQAGGTVQDGTINVDTYTMSDGQLAADATVVASNSFDLSSGDVDGVLDGSGALTKSGSGTVTLTNDNGYTGGTTVNDGTLALSGNGTLGADANTTTVKGGTLDLGGTNQTQQQLVQTSGTVQDGTINVDTYSMSDGQLASDATVIASNSFDLSSGDVDGVLDGSGALTKSGSGTVTLTNDNGYTGGTTVNDGTLALSGNGTLGADANTTTVNGGTLDLGGTNQTQQELVQAGGTVQDGTINVDTYTMSDGQLAADATVVASNGFDLSSGDVDGVLDGSGALTKSGSGTVTLTNDNGYTGGTTVNDGTLALGNGGSSGSVKGDIINNGTLKINRNDFIDLTNNNISGDGNVEFVGGGVNLLGDNNTYSGETSIENSLVAGSATSFGSGDVHNNGVVVLSQTETGTLSNRLNGGGDFYKIGSAALNLEGDGDFHGNFRVAEGKVAANSHLDQAHFYISQDAVLTGVGTLGGLTLESGALLATGNNNIGQMEVAGDIYKQKGSLWSVELGQIGSNDALFATGSAHIEDGAVLNVTNISGSRYTLGGAYTILAANEGVSGRYVLTGDIYVSAFYGLEADYSNANSVVLRVAQTKQYNEIDGLNHNQRNVAFGLQSLGVGNPLYNAIGYLTNEDDAKNAFTQLSGEIHASARSVAIEDSRFVREAALDRLTSDGTIDSNLYWWSHGFGSDGRFDNTSSNGSSDIDRTIGGGFAGVDVGVSDTWRIGALAGYSHSNFNTRWQTSSAEVQSYHAGIYGGGTVGPVNLRVGGAYSWQDVDTSRTVAFPGFSDNLTASYHNQVTQLFGEASHPFVINNVTFEPFAGLAYVHLKTDGFNETGGAASLSNDASTDDTVFTTLGFRASVPVSEDGATRLSGSAGWRYAYNDLTPSNSVSFASGSEAFSVGGLPIAKNVAVLELGLERKMTNGLGLEVKYSGQMNGDVQDHGARASLQWKF